MELKGLTGSDMNKLTVATMQVDALRKQVTDAQATIAALQAEVKDLKEWLAAYKQSIELAQSSLTQRTAELEATEKAYQDKTRLYIEQTGAVADLQAELERVSALVKALPKVEGEIRVAAVMHPNHFDEWHISAGDTWIMTIAGKQSADSVLCALQHRQGMEG